MQPLGPEGVRLAESLRASGIDPATLEVLFPRGEKSVHVLRIHGSRAIDLWRRLRGAVERTGSWPVILGKPELLAEIEESETRSPEEIIEAARKIDAASWLEKRVEEEPDVHEVEEGSWPSKAKPATAFQTPYDVLGGKPLPEVLVALVPTLNSWEAPAHLKYGAWNECPPPEAHVALMKRWHDLYGAEVACMADDVVEVQVARPPADRDGAMKLAREHFIYCTDIVHQGTETLEALASALLGSSVWYFWWD
jgi:hypothetical protein